MIFFRILQILCECPSELEIPSFSVRKTRWTQFPHIFDANTTHTHKYCAYFVVRLQYNVHYRYAAHSVRGWTTVCWNTNKIHCIVHMFVFELTHPENYINWNCFGMLVFNNGVFGTLITGAAVIYGTMHKNVQWPVRRERKSHKMIINNASRKM